MMQDKSADDLAKARTKVVVTIQSLNDQISQARLSTHKAHRRQLETQRQLKYNELRTIDAEFARRGLDPRNA